VVGGGIGVRAPERGVAEIDGERITWLGTPGARVPLRHEEVRFTSGGVSLAGTLTLPAGPGPFPAVAVVHGSGSVPRTYGQAFAQFFVRAGVAVLAYDKRGVAQSGGKWPGEAASPQNVDVYARDAQAAVRFLAGHPRLDRSRIGLWGASQAGWIIPLAASRERLVSFAVIGVGPVVTEGEQVEYSRHTTQGAQPPQASPEEIERAMDQARFGTDPVPWIRQLRIPVRWVFGGLDQHVPTSRSVRVLERIRAETGQDFSWRVFPNAPHSLLETGSGLLAATAAAPSFARGLLTDIREWLEARGFGSSPNR
jgi:dienelactone hydrolase